MNKSILLIMSIFTVIFLAREGLSFSFGTTPELVLQDSIPSPNGSWVADRFLKIEDTTTEVVVSLRHEKNSAAEKREFILQELHAGDILISWQDDLNLLIAAPVGNSLPDKPEEFEGIHIHYVFYPNDPDKFKNSVAPKTYKKTASFSYKFEATSGSGLPGAGCNLHMAAPDGDYFQNLTVLITARKTFAHKALKTPNQIIPVAARSDSSVNIGTNKEIRKSLSLATSAKIEEFSPDTGKVMRDRNFKQIKAPSGSYMPMWQVAYSLDGQKDIAAIVNKIRNGGLNVKVGFWLNNAEVIYSSKKPADLSEITKFENCITQNNIFQ